MNNTRKKKILTVDDDEKYVILLQRFCRNWGYDTITARNGYEALDKASALQPDLILLDVKMPVMDGFEAIQKLREAEKTKEIPVIILTAMSSLEDRFRGLSRGANDYIIKPFYPEELGLRIKNQLKMKEQQELILSHNISLQKKVEEKTKRLKETLEEMDGLYTRIRIGYLETIHRLSLMAEYKDEDTGEHIKRMSFYVKALSEEMEMADDFKNLIYYTSPMHDIGKVGIPDSILLKPGKLTDEEREIMKTHTLVGSKILSGSDSPFLKMATEIALSHHERWDGTGYPHGLRGEEIPKDARIMNIVDQYDALRSKRLYKPAFDHSKTFKILTEGDSYTRPEHFDPQVLTAFRRIHHTFEQIFSSTYEQEATKQEIS